MASFETGEKNACPFFLLTPHPNSVIFISNKKSLKYYNRRVKNYVSAVMQRHNIYSISLKLGRAVNCLLRAALFKRHSSPISLSARAPQWFPLTFPVTMNYGKGDDGALAL